MSKSFICTTCRRTESQCGDRLVWISEESGQARQICGDCLKEGLENNWDTLEDGMPNAIVGGVMLQIFSEGM